MVKRSFEDVAISLIRLGSPKVFGLAHVDFDYITHIPELHLYLQF